MLARQIATFGQIVAFELRYHLRQPSTYVYFAIFVLLGWLVAIGDVRRANVRVTLNAPVMIAVSIRSLSVFGLFIPLAILAHAALRDQRTKMDELMRAAPVASPTYLLGRFAGAFLVMVFVFCGVLIGLVVGTKSWWIDPAVVGSIRYDAYLSAMVIIALPNLFFAGALFYTAAALTRSMMATYVVLVAFLVAHFATLTIGDPEMRWLVSRIDPVGRLALDDTTRYWTVAERGTRLIPFTGTLALNCLMCVGMGAALLAIAIVLYRRRLPAGRPAPVVEAASAPKPATTVRTRRVPVVSIGGGSIWAQFISCARLETRAILRSWTFLALLVLGIAGFVTVLVFSGQSYGTPVLPMTHIVVGSLEQACILLLLVLAVLFSTEIVWREREAGIAEIVDATPVPSFVFLAAKLVAVALMLFAIVVAAAAVGIAFQLAKGVTRIDFHFYFVNLFVLLGLQMVMFAVLTTFVQALVNQKYIGLVIVLILMVVIPLTVVMLGARIPLLHFATHPDVPLSDMNQFGHFLPGAFWFLAFWGFVSVLLGVAAHALWIRGIPASPLARLRGMRSAMTPVVTAVAIVAVLGTGAVGSYIYWNIYILNPEISVSAGRQRAVDYEKAYRQFDALPQPRITEVEMEVDLYPQTRSFASRGRYTLVNRSNGPIETVHVRFDYDVSVDKVELADSTVIDGQQRFNHFVFRPSVPMQPGEARTLTFGASKHRKGFKREFGALVSSVQRNFRAQQRARSVDWRFRRPLSG